MFASFDDVERDEWVWDIEECARIRPQDDIHPTTGKKIHDTLLVVSAVLIFPELAIDNNTHALHIGQEAYGYNGYSSNEDSNLDTTMCSETFEASNHDAHRGDEASTQLQLQLQLQLQPTAGHSANSPSSSQLRGQVEVEVEEPYCNTSQKNSPAEPPRR